MNAVIADYQDYVEEIRGIRKSVFIKEQNVPEDIEIDGLDSAAKHVLVFEADKAIGTGRMLLDGHIGRIAVEREYRHSGVGSIIMKKLIDLAVDLQLSEVWLSSQYHVRGFYHKLGFIEIGDIYQEAGIKHIKMKRKLKLMPCPGALRHHD